MSNAYEGVIKSMFESKFRGAMVSTTDKATGQPTTYRIARLSDKMGKIRGVENEYVVLTNVDNESTVINLHPESALRLFKNGQESGLVVIEQQAAETAATEDATVDNAEQQADGTVNDLSALPVADVVKANDEGGTVIPAAVLQLLDNSAVTEVAADAAPADATDNSTTAVTAAVAKTEEAKTPSKKARAVAIIGEMRGDNKARKDIIARLMAEVGMTKDGAATYISNVSRKVKGWV